MKIKIINKWFERRLLRFSLAPMCVFASGAIASQDAGELDEFTGFAGEDPTFVMPTQPLEGALGFSKSIVDTPRSVSTISSDFIDKIGIRDGDQLSRIVPGTYTVNRWGIAGATQVRGLPADTYLRGMKRIDAQGNIRNVITMWENVEIVRGPPSPIFGNGRIGGYANYTPKSVRGTTGKYLENATTSFTALAGSYDRIETQFNYAQPLTFKEREGGFQVFGLASDADSYFKDNFQKDRVLQSSMSVDLNKRWRLETGQIYQRAINAGQAGANRVAQDTFDRGLYMRGTALVNLDTNNDGRVSEKEIQDSRGLTGTTPARPLSVSFGNVNLIRGPNTIIGAPQTFINLLQTNPDFAALAASAQGQAIINAGPMRYADGSPADALVNNLNLTPAGFFLDPTTVEFVPRDWSLVAIEEKADGFTHTGYLDFVADTDLDVTQKIQLFYDYQEQKKESQLPFNQAQKISVFETKYTLTRKADGIPGLDKLPEWVDLNLLASVNARYTNANRRATSGDYDHRRDLVQGYTPTDTFAAFIRTGDESFATGEPVSSDVQSKYWEMGIGAMADMTLFERLVLVGGIRKDRIDVTTYEGAVYQRLGTAVDGANITNAASGALTTPRQVSNTDSGVSHSLSASYKLPFGITPYYTTAESSSALTGTFQEISFNNVRDGAIISKANLNEVGVKGYVFNNKLFYALSYYEQQRVGNIIVEGESYNRSTENEGVELELRWVPNRNWAVIFSGTYMTMNRIGLNPAQSRTAAAHANYLGVADITDGAGNVIVPANSFLYGGNSSVTIPNSEARFNKFGQYPEWVLGSFVGYNWDNGLAISWSANWVDSVAASSELPDLLTLPSYITHNLSVAYDNMTWRVALTVRNALNEEYFVPNNGSFGGMLLQPGLPRNYEIAVSRRF
jgi:iron complex outermembrane recepter protein